MEQSISPDEKPDPRVPASFPRRVLVASLGLAPQVLTETVYALGTAAAHPFVPTEVHVITTKPGAARVRLALWDPKQLDAGALVRLAQHYALALPNSISTHIISGAEGELDDIDAESHNGAAADLTVELIRQLTQDPNAAVHASIAGGRKTMGFLMGYALSLHGRDQDRLSHVLVSQPFESHPQFFFPPNPPETLLDRNNATISTADARVCLADIPFVRLREILPHRMTAGEASYSELIKVTQELLNLPEMVIDIPGRQLVAQGCPVRLPPADLAFALWVVESMRATSEEVSGVSRDGTDPRGYLDAYERVLPDTLGREDTIMEIRQKGLDQNFIDVKKSRVNKEIERQLWPMAKRYQLRTKDRRIWFDIPLDAISVIDRPDE